MESKEVIEKIDEIYDRFNVPPNLRMHMIRSYKVGKKICENWIGDEINRENIYCVLLIHDLGNIVKFDFESEFNKKIFEDVDYWKKVQKEIIEKYGNEDHVVTERMATQLGVSERVVFLLRNKAFVRNDFILESDDWELKICAYADQRTGAFGVVSLKERFDECEKRYKGRKSSLSHPRAKEFIMCAYEIEKEVLGQTSLRAEDI